MDPITDLKLVYGKTAKAPSGYAIIPADLNSGTKGEFVWLAYSRNPRNGDPITGIQVTASKEKKILSDMPEDNVPVEGDLNKGAGGHFIYLSYTRNQSGIPITAVDVIIGAKNRIVPREGFTRIDQDCNEGARGNYVYICYMQGQPSGEKGKAITDLKVIYGEGATAPPGYTIIPADLNSGANGEYVWLAYSKSTRNGAPITDIKITASKDSDAPDNTPPDFIKLKSDLNKGAGGRYIYLSYSRNSSKPPITEIDVIIGTKDWIAPREGFVRVDQDCNQGAGGNFVFVCYKQ